MNNKKSGFVSMTLVYTFLIVFLFLMLAILTAYSEKNKFVDAINHQIDVDISSTNTSRYTLINKMLADNEIADDGSINFYNISNLSSGNGNGLYYSDNIDLTDENNNGNTTRMYFYRGEVSNNNLVFADMCFKIMRTNENSSVRIRYNGKYVDGKCNGTNISIAKLKYSDISESSSDEEKEKSIGYMYTLSDTTDSTGEEAPQSIVKKSLDNWYVNNILNKTSDVTGLSYANYVSDSTFCNARNVASEDDTIKYYAAKNLIPYIIDDDNEIIGIDETLKCNNKDDRFNLATLSGGTDETGNNLLSYPVGLVSANDVILAGGYLDSDLDTYKGGLYGVINDGYYMNISVSYWTMSPYSYDKTNELSKMLIVNEHGVLTQANVNDSFDVVPVISLNPGVVIRSGIGSVNDPYIIK